MFRQILDGIATVAEDPLVPINKGDAGITAGGGRKARIKGKIPRVPIKFAHVDNIGALRALENRKIKLPPCLVVNQGDIALVRGVGVGGGVFFGYGRHMGFPESRMM